MFVEQSLAKPVGRLTNGHLARKAGLRNKFCGLTTRRVSYQRSYPAYFSRYTSIFVLFLVGLFGGQGCKQEKASEPASKVALSSRAVLGILELSFFRAAWFDPDDIKDHEFEIEKLIKESTI